MTQQYTLKAMANNYRNGHSWDHLDSQVCMKAAEEIKELQERGDGLEVEVTHYLEQLEKLQIMLETMTADRDAEKAMKATAREQRDRVTSELTNARDVIRMLQGR